MSLLSSSEKIFSKRLLFHSFDSLSISSPTVAIEFSMTGGDCILNVEGLGIHLSCQIRTFSPFPIRHIKPSRIKPLALWMLRRAKDGFLLNGPQELNSPDGTSLL
jgi:hypothetical protein